MTGDEDAQAMPSGGADAAQLPDEAVVMRYGLSTPETLRKTALLHHDAHGDLAISVRCLPDMTADQLALLDPPQAHARIRATTVGALRAAGYDVVRDEPPPGHALIMLPRLPTDDDYVVVASTFGDPSPNPATRRESGGTHA